MWEKRPHKKWPKLSIKKIIYEYKGKLKDALSLFAFRKAPSQKPLWGKWIVASKHFWHMEVAYFSRLRKYFVRLICDRNQIILMKVLLSLVQIMKLLLTWMVEGYSNPLQIKKGTRGFNTKFLFQLYESPSLLNSGQIAYFSSEIAFIWKFWVTCAYHFKKREVTPIDMKRFKTLVSDSH